MAHLRYSRHEVAWGWGRLVWVEHRVGHSTDCGHPLHVLVGEVGLTLLLALGQGHVQRLCGNNTSIHLRHSLGGLLGGREAHKAKALAAATFHHHLSEEKPISIHSSRLIYDHTNRQLICDRLECWICTLALVMVPNGENSLRRRSSSRPSSRFFTYRFTP